MRFVTMGTQQSEIQTEPAEGGYMKPLAKFNLKYIH